MELQVTIIIATKNSSQMLATCLQSINEQTCRDNIQVIVKDAESEDITSQIANKYLKSWDTMITKKDSGIYDAWNQALDFVIGEWVLFLGSDDLLHNERTIEDALLHLVQVNGKEIKICYGNLFLKRKERIVEKLGDDWETARKRILDIMNLPHPAIFHHYSLFNEFGKFDTSFDIAGDYDLLLRYFKNGNTAHYMENVVITEMSDGGISGKLSTRHKMYLETKRARICNEVNNFSVPLFLWFLRIKFLRILSLFFPKIIVNHIADLYRVAIGKPKRWTHKQN